VTQQDVLQFLADLHVSMADNNSLSLSHSILLLSCIELSQIKSYRCLVFNPALLLLQNDDLMHQYNDERTY
jgi:hypothetical protein